MRTILTNLWGAGWYGREVLRGIQTFDPTRRRWVLRTAAACPP